MDRRRFIHGVGIATATALAGCNDEGGDSGDDEDPLEGEDLSEEREHVETALSAFDAVIETINEVAPEFDSLSLEEQIEFDVEMLFDEVETGQQAVEALRESRPPTQVRAYRSGLGRVGELLEGVVSALEAANGLQGIWLEETVLGVDNEEWRDRAAAWDYREEMDEYVSRLSGYQTAANGAEALADLDGVIEDIEAVSTSLAEDEHFAAHFPRAPDLAEDFAVPARETLYEWLLASRYLLDGFQSFTRGVGHFEESVGRRMARGEYASARNSLDWAEDGFRFAASTFENGVVATTDYRAELEQAHCQAEAFHEATELFEEAAHAGSDGDMNTFEELDAQARETYRRC